MYLIRCHGSAQRDHGPAGQSLSGGNGNGALPLLCLSLRAHPPARAAPVAILVLAGIWQAVLLRNYARTLIRPVDIATTIEYKVDTRIQACGFSPGQRTLVSGDPRVSSQRPVGQSHSVDRTQVQARPTGNNGWPFTRSTPEPTPATAMRNHSLHQPGFRQSSGRFMCRAKEPRVYHPIAHPHKIRYRLLTGSLAQQRDDTIFAVPQRSRSASRT